MRMFAFASRNAKEVLRDPLNVCFSLGFPLVVLFLLSAIQANIPVSMFEVNHLTPGIAVFGLSFMSLFSATLIAKDREGAFLQRLYTTPLKSAEFILGYALPIVPIAMVQGLVCFAAAIPLGLKIGINIVYCVLFVAVLSLFFVALGLLCGSFLSSKQVGGICGALLTNLAAWLSGTWFDLELVGGAFKKAAYALPFVHAVELERAVLNGNFNQIFPHLAWVLGWTAVVAVAAVMLFLRQMKKR